MEAYYGDLEKTDLLAQLFEKSADSRDDSWKGKFLDSVAEASFACGDPKIINGPDDFPYFYLKTPEPDKTFQCYVIKHMVTDFLLKIGLGVVVNPEKDSPDWIFSYGDILNFHLTGSFYSGTNSISPSDPVKIEAGEKVLAGQPSESYLPEIARKVIRDYLTRVGISDVRFMILMRPYDGLNSGEFVFNLTPGRFHNDAEYERTMRSIGWFLPRHYTYSSINEEDSGHSFSPL